MIKIRDVELSVGDFYWYINKKSFYWYNKQETGMACNLPMKEMVYENSNEIEEDKTLIRFLTKEDAQKWIDENKPKYSVKDIEKAFEEEISSFAGDVSFDMINKIKSRLS